MYNFDDPEQRELLRSILMTSCDIASITKPWDIQIRVAEMVVTEFFDQGDMVISNSDYSTFLGKSLI